MPVFMANPSDSNITTGIRRRPRAGERTRGAVDALQTKIAVNLRSFPMLPAVTRHSWY
jgi:hypothetical protein